MRKWLLKAEKLAGLKKLKGGLWHPYRRKFATDMIGVPNTVTARLGGWKTTRTLDIYQQPSDAELREGLAQRGTFRAAQ